MQPLRLSRAPEAARFRQVPMARRQALRPRVLGQGSLVQVNPEVAVSAPINIDLGGLPVSIGLFAGSGFTFLIKNELPPGWPRVTATLVGAGLAVGGILNLVARQAWGSPAPAPSSAPSKPGQTAAPSSPSGPVTASPGYFPPTPAALDLIQGRISAPAEFSTIDIWPWAKSYPVRIEFRNPTTENVTFSLELEASESPNGSENTVLSQTVVQVSLAAGETKAIDVQMPIASWDFATDFVDVQLTARKRAWRGAAASLLDVRNFVVE